MSEDTKKVEEKVEQIKQDVKEPELSEESLDKVAGGGGTNYVTSKSNVKTS